MEEKFRRLPLNRDIRCDVIEYKSRIEYRVEVNTEVNTEDSMPRYLSATQNNGRTNTIWGVTRQ